MKNLIGMVAVAALALGCDPEGPGASGKISLGAQVNAMDFASLEIRIYPDANESFDPAQMPSAFPATSSQTVAQITFPFAYSVGEGPNTSDEPRWRMVAWLTNAAAPERPASGEPFCSAPFELDSCGSFGDYCAVTGGVDCTIE
jgi:hypothetical protein